MAKKDLDWGNIGFAYRMADKRYVSNWKNGAWDAGGLIEDAQIVLNESACILQYCQQVFEGLKAYTWEDGSIVCFRPDLNAERIHDSAIRMEMPPFPKERFVEAVDKVVLANEDWVPPFGSGATLYIRPYEFATGIVIGVKPATEYQFRVFTTPVGPYYKGGAVPISIIVSDYDRAAPHGTGDIKAGLNYAMSLHPSVLAHAAGYAETLFLDAATRSYVEETGGANVLFVDKDRNLIVPKSGSILPSITRRSLVYVAEHYLHLHVVERKVLFSEIPDFLECALCGTAAVLSPVGRIVDHDKVIEIPSGMEKAGEIMGELYRILTGIQSGKVDAPEGWIHVIR